MNKIKILYISNYGNEEELLKFLKENKIEIISYGDKTGFMGCDPPYSMTIKTTMLLEQLDELLYAHKFPDTIFNIKYEK